MTLTDSYKSARRIVQITNGNPTSDGDGVKLTRIIGTPDLDMVDPFLMLDRFGTNNPGDYIGGFPEHPHRGFETVTYMLAGRMRHKDNAGHEGVIEPGGIQWMTAGRGILHSEMPEQTEGRMEGFQLWVNLPASEKMIEPAYQEFSPESVPVEQLERGGSIRVVAGITDGGTVGSVTKMTNTPLFLDVILDASGTFEQQVPAGYNGFIYVIDGAVSVETQEIEAGSMGVLGAGDALVISSGEATSRFLVVAGKALNEPVAKGGPFVMNTRAQVIEAFEDYRSGKF